MQYIMPAQQNNINKTNGATHKNLFIVNPNAGTKQAKVYLPQILDLFTENGGENSVHLTCVRGDGVKIALEHGKSADRIICIGGDGTLSEVITGMKLSGCEIPVGYIPAGTANDLANSLHLSKNIMQAAKDIIESDTIRTLDIGKFGERYFSYIASFGAFTKTSYSTPQSSKNMFGHFAYIIEAVKELPSIRPEYVRIETDGYKTEGDYIFGAFSNSKSFGGILSLNPEIVDMGDGLFEVLLIKPLNTVQAVWDCVYSLLNHNYNSEYITFFTTGKGTVYADPEMKWTLDGECADGHEKIEIENLCRAAKIIAR
ncbi:MAG: diacylglycerol kinase family lipid kinase [Oscillospiraceae bacterium]|nr:diacylglycerol kinase family lipid kinase [Oscillospiraceae bacterium]